MNNSIDNKAEIRINFSGVSNKNNKKIDAKIIDTIQQPSNNSQDNDNTVVINSSNRSQHKSEHTSTNIVGNGNMKHRFK